MKNLILCLLTLLAVASCSGNKPSYAEVKTRVEGFSCDTIYVYGRGSFFDRVDTIVNKEGESKTNIDVDTLVWTTLVVNDTTSFPLFIGKDQKINLDLKIDSLGIYMHADGNEENKLFEEFYQEVRTLEHSERVLVARDFIREHPSSLVSLYMIQKYLVESPNPNNNDMLLILERLSGELKDRRYTIELKDKLSSSPNIHKSMALPFFEMKDINGESVSKKTLLDNYTIIYFWASWDRVSREKNKEYAKLLREHKKLKHFKLLGVSLDIDRNNWKEAIEKDSLGGVQASELKGWDSDIVKKIGVEYIPYNLLISKEGVVENMELGEKDINELIEKIKKENKEKKEKKKTPTKKKDKKRK